MLGQFQQFFILPQHIWAQHLGNNGDDLKTFPNNAPVVGSGPFNLVKYQKNQIALFQRNNSYWGTKPKIEEFGLQQFSNDDAMVTALKAHGLDAIEAVPVTAMKTLRQAGFAVSDVTGLDQTRLHHQLEPEEEEATASSSTRRSRRRSTTRSTARRSSASSSSARRSSPTSIIPASAGAGWHDPHLKVPELQHRAREQAARPGSATSAGSGGIRVANGKKMSYDVIAPTDVQSIPRTFEILQTDFREDRRAADEKALDSTAAFDQITSPNNKYLDFDLAMWDWIGSSIPTSCSRSSPATSTAAGATPASATRPTTSCTPQQQLTTTPAKRRQIVWKMQAYLYKQRPYIQLANDDSVSAVSKNWAGFKNTPQGPFNELNILEPDATCTRSRSSSCGGPTTS